MDFADLQNEVRERLGEVTSTFDTEGDFWLNAEIRRALNEAVRRFCSEEQWPFLITEWTDGQLTSDSDELDLPSNVSLSRVFNISIDGTNLARPQMVERVSAPEGFRLRHEYDGHTGAPRWYYITRSDASTTDAPPITYTARFIPYPDGTYDVEAQYFMVPTDLGASTDEPLVPDEYQEAIVAWATGKLWLKEYGVGQKSSEQFQMYYKVLAQAQKDLKAMNNTDEIVAWGRRQPLRGFWAQEFDPRFRIPPTLG